MSDLNCQVLSDDFPNFDLSFKLILLNYFSKKLLYENKFIYQPSQSIIFYNLH